jgi:hypothetical protein
MLALVGTIVGLTAHVIETSKETSTGSSGITTVKGSNQPTATANIAKRTDIRQYFASDVETPLKSLYLRAPDGSGEFSNTVTG